MSPAIFSFCHLLLHLSWTRKIKQCARLVKGTQQPSPCLHPFIAPSHSTAYLGPRSKHTHDPRYFHLLTSYLFAWDTSSENICSPHLPDHWVERGHLSFIETPLPTCRNRCPTNDPQVSKIRNLPSPSPSYSMSSVLAHPPPAPFSASSNPDLGGFQEARQRHTQQGNSWRSLVKEGRLGGCFASGLPTPPETRAMTGVRLNQHNSNDVVSQSYCPSKFSNPGHSHTRSADVGYHQHNIESSNHNRSSSRDQPQFWRANREKENSHAVKGNSSAESAIASYLQIPSSINDSKGSLAEFAAEVGHLSPTSQTFLTVPRSHVFSGSNRLRLCSGQMIPRS